MLVNAKARNWFFVTLFIIILTCLTGVQTLSAEPVGVGHRKPNIVIIFPDQLRWSEVGCYGNPVIRTPNIDRMAAGGVRFTNAFSNFPVCSPARSILLSGRYARSNGLDRNQDHPAGPGRPTNRDTTMAEALNAAGYMTGLVGKWHLAPKPPVLGFKESLRPFFRHRYYQQKFYKNEGKPYIFQEFAPFHELEAAVKFIKDHKDEPFFLYYSPGPPHMPIDDLPDQYRTMYDPAQVVMRPNTIVDGKLAYDENWFKIYMWDFLYYEHLDTFKKQLPKGMNLRDLTALYYGQVSVVDDCAGRVLDIIRELGLEEDTIVLFTADHGDLLGSHGLFNKNTHHEESIHIPMIIRYPRKLETKVVDTQMASLVDVMPTLLDLAGVEIPDSVQGQSLVPVLTGRRLTVGNNEVYIETTDHDGMRTRRYVYAIEREGSRQEMLFDVIADPYQMNNLASDPQHDKLLKTMRSKVQDWIKRTPKVKPIMR